ncbi:MAG: hypothetical protein H5T95_09150 [Firmicutes bacterium]|nr:hypothetical protein [Bacillota bacterium]
MGLASMLFGLAVISCLVAVTGGADGPLLFLFIVPAFTYRLRSEPRSAYLSAAINSAALAVISVASSGDEVAAELRCSR